mmetsp:Transcript_25317/g.56232  ORF Transcript_25317/g.56232 Transcript_25317/m.56232 type:complete len:329 (-) Transcript_25317:910-1896(-)
MDEPDLLEEVGLDRRPAQLAVGGEADVNVLPEAGGVVIPDGAGIPERFEDGVGLEDLLLDGNIPPILGGGGGKVLAATGSGRRGQVAIARGRGGHLGVGNLLGQHGEVVQNDLGGHRLPGTGFAANQDGLVGGCIARGHDAGVTMTDGSAGTTPAPSSSSSHEPLILDPPHHGPVGIVGGLVRVGRQSLDILAVGAVLGEGLVAAPLLEGGVGGRLDYTAPATTAGTGTGPAASAIALAVDAVPFHHVIGIERHSLEGVDGNQNGTGAGVDDVGIVAQSQGVKDGRFVQMGQPDQIIDAADYAIIDVGARTGQNSRLGIFPRNLIRCR